MTHPGSLSGGDAEAGAPPAVQAGVAGRRRSLGRSTAIFAVWTGVSRVAGLAREILAAAIFGTQGAINAFVIAFQVPNLLRSLVADSALSAAFLPVFTELEEQGRGREARRLAGAMIGLIGMALGLVTLVAIAILNFVLFRLLPGDPITSLLPRNVSQAQ